MTNAEQDKGLREKLYSIFEIDCDYYSHTVQNGCGYDGFYCKLHATMLDNAMQLIIADRKRVALEARIDEQEMTSADADGAIDVGDVTSEQWWSTQESRIEYLKSQLTRLSQELGKEPNE